MTVFLSVVSFPIAMAGGLLLAVGRVYGPKWVRVPLAVYVELFRGTPLLLQLYAIFYLLPPFITWLTAHGVWVPIESLSPLQAGILGLALNYAAYEAENYRAGLQSVPKGQVEAGLALGMSRLAVIRRVVVPAGRADRHSARDERLHRPVQRHRLLLRHPHHRTDAEVQRTLQLQSRLHRDTRLPHGRPVPADELPALTRRPVDGAAVCDEFG